MKKTFSIILSIFLLITVMPTSSFAMSATCTCGNEYDDNGFCLNIECNGYQPAVETIDKYDINDDSIFDIVYEISNAGQLYWFAEQVNNGNNEINGIVRKNIVVNTGDLKNYDGESANDWKVWIPIAYPDEDRASYNFKGTFDGNHYDISGLYYNDATRQGVGLFGVVEGVVKNVGIKNSYFHAKKEVGAICGALQGEIDENKSKIEYCTSDATVVGDEGYVGGICGASGHIIKGCYNSGSITSVDYSAQYTGGIVGYSAYVGSLSYCCNGGEVVGFYYTGGVCGYNDKYDILECYNHGNVTGYLVGTGGVCGVNNAKTIKCFNTGDVLGDEGVGGICGSHEKSIEDCYNTSTITCFTGYAGGISGMTTSSINNSYNIGEIVVMSEGVGCFVGGICGNAASESLLNCYYLSGCAVDGAGVTQNGIGVLDLGNFAEDGIGTISKTVDKFENGEVCYLLNGEKAGTDEYVWAQSIGYNKYPMIGGEPVFYKESENKYFNLDFSLFSISHQPTAEEPYVELYEDFRAQYQWYSIEKDLIKITEDNAEKVTSYGGNESFYDNEIGWTAVMDEDFGPHDFSYFTVELEAGDTLFVELSDDKANYVRAFNFDTYESVGELVISGKTTYSLTVETAGKYRFYVTHMSNTVTVNAFVGEINYNKVEGATSYSYYPTEPGLYACLVTYADGSTELSEFFEVATKESFTGIKDNHFYIDDVMQKAYRLVEFNGDFYFIGDRHEIVKNKNVNLTEARINGLTYADGTPIVAGSYEFDDNGKMIMREGVIGNKIYKNNTLIKAYQLVEVDGDIYYIGDRHEIIKGRKAYVNEARINGLTYADGTPITPGYYEFDENGKMVILNGVVGNNIYKNNTKLKAYQLVEVDGDFYFIGDRHQIVKNRKIYLTDERINGLTYENGKPITPGFYEIDSNGKMIIVE